MFEFPHVENKCGKDLVQANGFVCCCGFSSKYPFVFMYVYSTLYYACVYVYVHVCNGVFMVLALNSIIGGFMSQLLEEIGL